MESQQFQKIQAWFETLNGKIETLDGKVDALDLKLENRFQLLFNSIVNLSKKVESYKNQQDEEIALLKRALHDLESEVKELHSRVGH